MNIDAVIAQGLSQQASPSRQEAVTAKVTTTAPVAANASQASTAPPTIEQVHAAAEQIAQFLKSSGRALDFHVDNDTGQVVVSVRDVASGDLIRQMPSEEALHLARTLNEGSKSLVALVA
jgi:flagellar protein FlaG